MPCIARSPLPGADQPIGPQALIITPTHEMAVAAHEALLHPSSQDAQPSQALWRPTHKVRKPPQDFPQSSLGAHQEHPRSTRAAVLGSGRVQRHHRCGGAGCGRQLPPAAELESDKVPCRHRCRGAGCGHQLPPAAVPESGRMHSSLRPLPRWRRGVLQKTDVKVKVEVDESDRR